MTNVLTSERDSDGLQLIYRDGVLIAVHGQFCTGCTATRGVCGKWTAILVDNAS